MLVTKQSRFLPGFTKKIQNCLLLTKYDQNASIHGQTILWKIMKIAYIGQKGIPAKTGGVERYVEEVAIRMAKLGHEVFVYARSNYTPKRLKRYRGVTVVNLPSIPTKNLDAISHTFLASLHALFQNYDVIHYSSIGPTSLSVIPKFLKKRSVIISTFQCQDYLHKKWGGLARAYLRFSEKLTCLVPDKTIVVTDLLRLYSKDKYGKELVRIPNGTAFRQSLEDSELSTWGLEKGKYIFCASRLVGHKGVHFLIKAFNDLQKQGQHQDKRLVIAGSGAYTDEYVTYLHDLAKENKNVIFTGTVDGAKLEQLFSHSYMFVQPSESEGMSLALLEAMGYGKAILASDIAENLEALKGSGLSFRSGDEKDLEQKLLQLLDNPVLAKARGKESLEVARANYTWEDIVAQIEQVYEESLRDKEKKKLKKLLMIVSR